MSETGERALTSNQINALRERFLENRKRSVRKLNDLARTAMGVASRLRQTPGISALPVAYQSAIREAVEKFDKFDAGNDPHEEHDFGCVECNGVRAFWKIDYYDKALEFGSDEPWDPAKTTRVLTIMLAEEY